MTSGYEKISCAWPAFTSNSSAQQHISIIPMHKKYSSVLL